MVTTSCFGINSINWSLKSRMCILRVEVPDGSYTLVPEDVNEGAGGGVHYVTIEQDSGQSPVTTPPEIIPYYRLNHSVWSLSDNKEISR
jgi:hypothetical protein